MTNPVRYSYIKWTMIHEFGHALGLPDFYVFRKGTNPATNYDSGLDREDAIMNKHREAKEIKASDIDQLDAIYRLHSKH